MDSSRDTQLIPFNRPYMTGRELDYIRDAFERNHLSGNGFYTGKCSEWLEQRVSSAKGFLTNSCTDALEMAAILLNLQPGDEVIMPSFTFVTTATAFALRGAKPVFVDIRPDTLNIDETKIEEAITERTKAIVPVHYAGVSCEMDYVLAVAKKYNLMVVEDAAHGLLSTYNKTPVGSKSHMAAFSFHETKNISSGEGGALMVNDTEIIDRAYMVWEKGSNRREFNLGIADKYTWRDLGSSYPMSELSAAFLYAQMEHADEITAKRISIWNRYNELFQSLAKRGLLTLPQVPDHCIMNGHIYYALLTDAATRTSLLKFLKERKIGAVFHYIPLHDSPAGKIYARPSGDLAITSDVSSRLVRFPIWIGLTDLMIERIVLSVEEFFSNKG